jgi:hypothetical protein
MSVAHFEEKTQAVAPISGMRRNTPRLRDVVVHRETLGHIRDPDCRRSELGDQEIGHTMGDAETDLEAARYEPSTCGAAGTGPSIGSRPTARGRTFAHLLTIGASLISGQSARAA